MENKKLHIALAIVVALIVLLGVFAFIHFSEKEANEEVFKESPDTYLDQTVNYDVGEYRYISVSEQDLLIAYYKNFINEVKNNPKDAWNMLTDDCKEDKFHNLYSEFESFVKKYLKSSIMDTYTVKKYSTKNNKLSLVDSQNILYNIKENGIWNYKIEIVAIVDNK